MRRLFDVPVLDLAGNLPAQPEIYPDYRAPIIRQREGGQPHNGGQQREGGQPHNGDQQRESGQPHYGGQQREGGRELTMARWGMPTPPQYLVGKRTDRGVTNIRNTQSPHWRRWLGPENRCLVPFTRFSEPDSRRSDRGVIWFQTPDDMPAFFAGIWTRWTSVRKLAEGETTDDLFGFLTTDPNGDVAPAHPKAMPVILTTPQAWDIWLHAPWTEARGLQRPLPAGILTVV